MSTNQIVVLVLVLLVVAAIAAALVAQSRKRKRLQSTFGPEYDRTVQSSDRRRDAERELAEREQRRKQLDIRPLPAEDRRMFSERWRGTQADFVDQPEQAVRQADALVAEVMGRRGYPVGDFEQMSRDVSVDHAHVVQEYRAAHEISELNDRKQATTEQLRQAMVHYRALFTDLLSDTDGDDHRDTAADARADGDREYRGVHAAPDDSYDDDRDDDRHEDRDDDRTSGAPAYPTSTAGDRLRDDRQSRGDQSQDGVRDLGYATTEDHVHTRSADAERSADERVTSDRTASDGDRTERTSDRTATSHVEGVRVEQGGLHRNHLEDQDRPRA